MNIIKSQNPEEINVHRQIWGENAEEVIYGGRNNNREWHRTTRVCDSRIAKARNCAFVVI
jgi:hypothetical protein